MVVPGTFERLDEQPRLMPWHLVTVVPRAMRDAQAVIFFVLVVGGVVGVVRRTGAIDAAVDRVLVTAAIASHGSCSGIEPVRLLSASVGMGEEYLAFLRILVLLCAALRLDAVVAVASLMVGHGVGFAAAPFNPFTVLVAQQIAGGAAGFGAGFRLLLIAPMSSVAIPLSLSIRAPRARGSGASLVGGLAALSRAGEAPSLHELDGPPRARARRLRGSRSRRSSTGDRDARLVLAELTALFLALGSRRSSSRGCPSTTPQDVQSRRRRARGHGTARRVRALDRV